MRTLEQERGSCRAGSAGCTALWRGWPVGKPVAARSGRTAAPETRAVRPQVSASTSLGPLGGEASPRTLHLPAHQVSPHPWPSTEHRAIPSEPYHQNGRVCARALRVYDRFWQAVWAPCRERRRPACQRVRRLARRPRSQRRMGVLASDGHGALTRPGAIGGRAPVFFAAHLPRRSHGGSSTLRIPCAGTGRCSSRWRVRVPSNTCSAVDEANVGTVPTAAHARLLPADECAPRPPISVRRPMIGPPRVGTVGFRADGRAPLAAGGGTGVRGVRRVAGVVAIGYKRFFRSQLTKHSKSP